MTLLSRPVPTLLLMATLFVGAASCAETDAPPPALSSDTSAQRDMDEAADMASLPKKDLTEGGLDASSADALMLCTQGERRCTGAGGREVCQARGMWEEDACEEGSTCQEGECTREKVCEEGVKACVDAKTVQVCRPGGLAYVTQTCEGELSCAQGECKSGSGNGAACVSDDQCLGGSCHCAIGESCPGGLAPAYCTAKCESGADCAQNEMCLNAQVHMLASQVGNYSHCVATCAGACANPGQACLWVPTKEGATAIGWTRACTFSGLREMGNQCDADGQCLSEECSTAFFKEGSCTRRCEEGGCPGNTVCAELKSGEFWCTLPCKDGVCPLDVPKERIDVTCLPLRVKDGPRQEVCSKT